MNHSFSYDYRHVHLRPLERNDIEGLRILRNRNREFFINSGIIESDRQIEWFEAYLKKDSDIMFAVECKALGFAGAIAIYDIDYNMSKAEFGRIVIAKGLPKYTGTYAIEALLLFARDILKLSKVFCSVMRNNERAIGVYERLGFKEQYSGQGLRYYKIELSDIVLV